MAGNTAYKNEWSKKNCDQVRLIVPKGDKEKIKAAAAARGSSVNAFIIEAITEKMRRENK